MEKKNPNTKPTSTTEKDILSKIEQEFKRHTGVLMEEMKSTVKTVTEQYSSMNEKIDTLQNDVTILKNDMAVIKPTVEQHSKDIKVIKSTLDSIQGATMENSRDIKILKGDVARIEQKLDTVTTDHEQRIQKLEAIR